MSRFPKDIEDRIQGQGWYAGRQYAGTLDRPEDFERIPAAEAILSEFEGLKLGVSGPGLECATADIDMDPSWGDGMAEEVHAESNQIGRQIRYYPLAGVQNGHQTMFVDDDGTIYLYFDRLERFAPSFDEALVLLLRGVRSRPHEPQL